MPSTIDHVPRDESYAHDAEHSAAEFNRRVLESSPDCIKVMSLDARLEFFSVGGLCAMEVDDFERQLRGAPWLPFWAPEDRPRVLAAIDAALAGGTGRFQAFCPTAKGTPKWWDVSVSALRAADGTPQRLLSISRDITELKTTEHALRESGERLRLATEAAAVGTWDYDLSTGTLRWDDRTRALFGVAPGAPVDMALFFAGLHPDDRPEVEAAVTAALVPGGPGGFDMEYRIRNARDGSERWVAARGRAFFAQGEAVRFIGTVIDVDDRRRALEAARSAQAALADADARKDEFLATLAHELRNPLSPVLNAVRVLQRHESLSEAGQRAAKMIERQTRQMTRLVEDLLEVARITRGTIELRPEPMLLGVAIQNAVEASLPAFDAKGQRLRALLPAEPLRLRADPVRVAQVLENLLTNASKYTPAGGNACIEASEDADAVTIRVSDDGIGLEPGQLETVFDLFVQVEAGMDQQQGGLGIGLAMVKRLVEMHGGTVHAESAGRGCGAAFVVRLPKHATA